MKTKMRAAVLFILIGCLWLVVIAFAAPETYTLERFIIGGGGGKMDAGQTHLAGTIGQAIVGDTSAGTRDLCSGFWCGLNPHPSSLLYIPIVNHRSP